MQKHDSAIQHNTTHLSLDLFLKISYSKRTRNGDKISALKNLDWTQWIVYYIYIRTSERFSKKICLTHLGLM